MDHILVYGATYGDDYEPSSKYCKHLSFDEFSAHDYYHTSKDFLNQQSSSNKLKKVMRNSSSYNWEDYAQDTAMIIIPWAICAVVALILWVIPGCISACCACCCKKKVAKAPSFMTKIILFLVAGALLMGALVCASIDVAYLDDAYEGYNQAQCAAYRMPYEITYGTEYKDSTWIGLIESIDLIDEVIDLLETDYVSATDDTFDDTDWLDDQPDEVNDQIEDYYEEYTGEEVDTPDPNDAGDKIATYYTSILGPPSLAATYTGTMAYEVDYKLGSLIEVMKEIKDTSTTSVDNMKDIIEVLKTSKSSLKEFKDGMDEVHSNLKKWLIDNRDSVEYGWKGISLSLLLMIVMIQTTLLVLLAVVFLRLRSLSGTFYWSWCGAGFTAVIGFLLSAILVGFCVVLYDYCDFSKDVTTTEGLHEYDHIIPSESADYLNVCFNEDGNLAEYLNIDETLAFANELLDYYKQFETYDANIGYLTNLTSLAYNEAKIQSTLNFVAVSPSDAPDDSLSDLNSWSDYSVSGSYQKEECSGTAFTYDNWVTSSSNCKSGYTYTDSSDPIANRGSKACLQINEWDQSQVSQRYDGYFTCQSLSSQFKTVAGTIEAYQEQYADYMNSVTATFTVIQVSFTELSVNIQTLATQSADLAYSIENYYVKINTTLTSITDELSGLENVLNCSFMKKIKDDLDTGSCKNLMPSSFILTLCLLLASIFLIASSILALVLARKMRAPSESSIVAQ
mmetsp:Transcript_8436/g.16794  ORF Transcript_8436/g.16794 Transcript_8436/m.16794 type:complete len:734 (-) Transcript_8436:2343-4544(-)